MQQKIFKFSCNPTTHFPARDLHNQKEKKVYFFFFKFAIATTKSIVAIKAHANFAFFFGNYQYPKMKNDFISISNSNRQEKKRN